KALETAGETETFDEEIHTVIAGGQINRVEPHATQKKPAKTRARKKSIGKPVTKTVAKTMSKTAAKKTPAKTAARKSS
ncbi:MAG: hypothetical protein MPK36_08815, partial [Gammaproteobacteria bacterium]|nr:hypothetical protein [Gammaproteobacteria bacterium]